MRTNTTMFLATAVLSSALAFGQQPGSAAGQSPSTMPGGAAGSTRPNTTDTMPQTDQHMDMGTKKMSKGADEAFVLKAAQGGMAEMMTGKLATEKASDPDVKAYGQQMIDDHTKANDQLAAIAKDKGMTIPTSTDAKHQAMYQKLSTLSGAEFDKMYVKDMLKDHEEDVKDFQKESTRGKDEQIKSYATQTLPVLQQHLDKVKSLQTKTGSASSTK